MEDYRRRRRRRRCGAWFGCCMCLGLVNIAFVLVLIFVVGNVDSLTMMPNTTSIIGTTTTTSTPSTTATTDSTTTTSTTMATTTTSTTGTTVSTSTSTTTGTTATTATTGTTMPTTTTAGPTIPASFSLMCPPEFVGELELNPPDVTPALAGTPSVVGTGCGGNTVFNSFFTDTFVNTFSFIPSKKDMSGEHHAYEATSNQTLLINCTTMDMHVMPVPMDPEEHNMTVINGTASKRDYLFPDASATTDAISGILFASDAVTGQPPNVPMSVSIAVNHNLTDQVQQTLFGTGFATAAYNSGIPIGTYFTTSFFSSGACAMGTLTQEIFIKYDFEVERWLIAFVAPDASTVCVALSDTSDANAAWSGYSFTTPTPLANFEFAIWGDYYTWCADTFLNSAQCYIIERAEIIGGTGMPRMCAMLPFQSVSVDGGVGFATPLDQMHNNRSGLAFTSFPCGVFYVPLSNLNRIGQLGCTSVDFDTCTVGANETFTTYTAWSTASGSCTASNDCVPTNTGTLDPLRNRMSVVYYHDDVYPNHLAWALSYDSNGVDNAKIRWQEGTFSLSGPPLGFQLINDGAGTQQWHPQVAIDEFHTLLITYYYADESSNFALINYKYRLRTSPASQLSNRRAITPNIMAPLSVFDNRLERIITTLPLKRQPNETVVTRTRPFYVSQLSEPSTVNDDYFQVFRMVRVMIQRIDRLWNYQDAVCLSNVTCTQTMYLK